MRNVRRRHHVIATAMAVVMTVTSWPANIAQAGMISTRTIIESTQASEGQSTATAERLHALLARDDVRAQMMALGVDPAEAILRVDALTDEELVLLAGRLEDLPAGEGAMTTFALVAVIVAFVISLATRSWSGGRRSCTY
jgi:hypothetical protein